MINEHLIVLDFDHTVFNTTRYLEVQVKEFSALFGISEEIFLKGP